MGNSLKLYNGSAFVHSVNILHSILSQKQEKEKGMYYSVLQIKRGNRDNLEVIFCISP